LGCNENDANNILNNIKSYGEKSSSTGNIKTVEDVLKFLERIGITKVVIGNFKDNEIDFQALKSLTANELKEEYKK
jgi:hypothetical protein